MELCHTSSYRVCVCVCVILAAIECACVCVSTSSYGSVCVCVMRVCETATRWTILRTVTDVMLISSDYWASIALSPEEGNHKAVKGSKECS